VSVGFLLTGERGKSLLDTTTNSKALARGLDCASPESIMDPLNRTPAGDQYSLGCILYFCLAGRYPFVEANPVKKMLAHQFNEPEPLRKLVPECPPRLARIVERLLRKRPEERYDTMAEVVEDLQAVASDTRGAVSMPEPARKEASTRIPAPAVVPSARRTTIKGERPGAEPAPSGGGVGGWMILAAAVVGSAAGVAFWLLR
jgi:serine/threonine protein kinase